MNIKEYTLKPGEVWEYELIKDKNGYERLVKCGYKNRHKEIQEQAKNVGIHNYIQTDAHGNITSIITNKKEPTYGDFTQVPETMSEARKQLLSAKETSKWIKEETLRQEGAEAEKKKAETLKTANNGTKTEAKKEEIK